MPTDVGPMTLVVAVALGLAMVGGYIALAVWAIRKVWTLTVGRRAWVRILACASVATVFFAPSPIGVGHGAAIGPAWVALVDPSNRYEIRSALISLSVTFLLLFAIGVVSRSVQKHREK